MQITLDIPNPPTNQEIIDIPLHFCGGKVVEAGGYGFEERKTDTCQNDGKDSPETDQFICSKCGIELLDWTRYIGDECYDYVFKFCPNCGRRIEEGAEE